MKTTSMQTDQSRQPTHKRTVGAILLVVLTGLAPAARANLNIPAEAGMSVVLGQGFDSILFNGRETPFEEGQLQTVLDTSNNGVFFEKQEVQHRLDVFKALSGGVAGSYSWGLGGVQGSLAGLSFQQTRKTSYHLLVKVESIVGWRRLSQTPRLSAQAKALLSTTNPDGFLRAYGDHYVRNVKQGGRFFALINIESQEDETREEIQARLSGGDVTTDFSGYLNNLKQKTEGRYSVSIAISFAGGYTNVPSLTGLEAFYLSFPQRVAENPASFDYEAYPILQHPEVAAVLAPDQLKHFDRRRTADQIYLAIRGNDLSLEDVSYLEMVSAGTLFNKMTNADKDMLARARGALKVRSDWYKQALYEVVELARIPDLLQAPGVPVLPFDLRRIAVQDTELLKYTIPLQEAPHYGGAPWPSEGWYDITMRVRDGAVWLQGNSDWSWVSTDGSGNYYILRFRGADKKLSVVPEADYYLLPSGESQLYERTLIDKTWKDWTVDLPGSRYVSGGRRYGEHRVELFVKPFRLLSLRMVPVAPTILAHPVSQQAAAGESVILSVEAYGSGALSLQWRRNGVALSGQTNAVLFITSLTAESAGVYTVEVRNEVGALLSKQATVRMNPADLAPSITSHPASASVMAGGSVMFGVVASGTGTLSYVWRKDGIPMSEGGGVSGATTATLTLSRVQGADAGAYEVVVSNAAGSTTSRPATLTVQPLVESLPHPGDTNGDYRVVIGELTAYAASWKRGEVWVHPPNPIPIGHVTRAGYLWRGGERYRYDPDSGSAPLCWVLAPSVQVRRLSQAPSAGAGSSTALGTVSGVQVTLSVTPVATVAAYAVQDGLPAGFSATNISGGGVLDASARQVKWGPFFDSQARVFAYTLVPPAGFEGSVLLVGVASFDGNDVGVAGERRFQAGGVPAGSKVTRAIATGGGSAQITLSTAPQASVAVHAIEEAVPAGFTVNGINESGAFDPATRKVKWGPFFDATPRVLEYRLTAPVGFSGTAVITGVGSYDGVDVPILGPGQFDVGGAPASAEYQAARFGGLVIHGATGARYRIQYAASLDEPVQWTTLQTITLGSSPQPWADLDSLNHPRRFYRVVSPE